MPAHLASRGDGCLQLLAAASGHSLQLPYNCCLCYSNHLLDTLVTQKDPTTGAIALARNSTTAAAPLPPGPAAEAEAAAEAELAEAHVAGDWAGVQANLEAYAVQQWAASPSAIRRTELGALFQGQQLRARQCLNCNKIAATAAEPFNIKQVHLQGVRSTGVDGRAVPLSLLLREQTGLEIPPDFRCDCCGAVGTTKFREALARLPEILVVHLNRATMDGGRLSTSVDFEDELDLAPCLMFPASAPADYHLNRCGSRYRLYAACVHRGASARSGHYLSYIRAPNAYRAVELVGLTDRFDDPVGLLRTEVGRAEARLMTLFETMVEASEAELWKTHRRGLSWHKAAATGVEIVGWLRGRKEAATSGFGQLARLSAAEAFDACAQLLSLGLLEPVDGGSQFVVPVATGDSPPPPLYRLAATAASKGQEWGARQLRPGDVVLALEMRRHSADPSVVRLRCSDPPGWLTLRGPAELPAGGTVLVDFLLPEPGSAPADPPSAFGGAQPSAHGNGGGWVEMSDSKILSRAGHPRETVEFVPQGSGRAVLLFYHRIQPDPHAPPPALRPGRPACSPLAGSVTVAKVRVKVRMRNLAAADPVLLAELLRDRAAGERLLGKQRRAVTAVVYWHHRHRRTVRSPARLLLLDLQPRRQHMRPSVDTS